MFITGFVSIYITTGNELTYMTSKKRLSKCNYSMQRPGFLSNNGNKTKIMET